MRRWAGWTLVLLATAGVGAVAATWLWPGPGVARAVWMSGGVAVAVQLATFALARATQRENVVAGWGAGMIVRIVAIAAYALLVVNRLALPAGPALISLGVFLVVTTVVEPLFLRP